MNPATPPVKTPAARDFKSEVAELLSAKPELRGQKLPDAVVQAAVTGNKRLINAYMDWQDAQRTAELEALRKENNTLKQNAASAAKAPVRGVTQGGKTDMTPDDPFIRGFDSDDW